MDYYEFVRGPFAIIAFTILILGTFFRMLNWVWIGKKSKMLYPRESLTGGVRSVFHHLVPFGARYMRERPIFTLITVLFHISVVILPIFLLAHIVLWFESFDILWWHIPNHVADVMTAIVLASCIFFIGRRLIIKEVRMVSGISDYLFPIAIFISFLSGFLALHQLAPYRPTLIFHIFSSEVLIMLIPFTRLMHMIFFMFSRAYMGAEYNKVLRPADW
jgi:nitrate reductase gamma subunit